MNDPQIIVVGGGPAGAVTAGLLARGGLRVTVLEGTRFPRFHVGESLLAMSMPFLADFGVQGDLSANFIRKHGAVLVWGVSDHPWRLGMPTPGYAYQVDRAMFDAILLTKARDFGADIRHGHWVSEFILDDTGRVVGVRARSGAGAGTGLELRADVVVDATGLGLLSARTRGFGLSSVPRDRVSVFGRFTGAARLPGIDAGAIVSLASRDGWLWFIPLTEDVTSVGFVGDADALRGATPRDVIRDQIATTVPWFRKELMGRATMVEGPRLTRYTNHIVDALFWGPGYALVGDAAFFVDPLLSTGVHSALKGAYTLASGLLAVSGGTISEPDAATWYDDTMRRHARRLQVTVTGMYGLHPGDAEFWRARTNDLARYGSSQRIASILGESRRTFFADLSRRGVVELGPPLDAAVRTPEVGVRPEPPGDGAWQLNPFFGYQRTWVPTGRGLEPVLTFGPRADEAYDRQVRLTDDLARFVDELPLAPDAAGAPEWLVRHAGTRQLDLVVGREP